MKINQQDPNQIFFDVNGWLYGFDYPTKQFSSYYEYSCFPHDLCDNAQSLLPSTFPMVNNPVTGNMYFGFSELYKRLITGSPTYNQPWNQVWQQVSDLCSTKPYQSTRQITEIAIAESDPNYVYLVTGGQIHDADITPSMLYLSTTGMIPTSQFQSIAFPGNGTGYDIPIITGIAVDPNNATRFWISFTGYQQTYKVYGYDPANPGNHWANADQYNTLANLPVNGIVYQAGSSDRLYIVTDAGVYVNNGSNWEKYGDDFPNVRAVELKINYCANKLRVATYGRGVWEGDLLPTTQGFETVISSNTTWSTVQNLKGDLRVNNGATLTVTNVVNMPPDSKVIVEPGSKLIIDGGTFTNSCGSWWQGIECWGQSNQRPISLYQGLVNVLNNGKVENAEIGILSGKRSGTGYDDTFTGGIVWANSGIITNNKIGIYFRPYTQFTSNPTFTQCTFSTTSDIIDIDQFDSFIKVSDISGVTTNGCTFINSFSTDPTGTGIYATGSGVHVGAYCTGYIQPCPDVDLVHCSFTNLLRGIYAVNTPGSHGISVAYSDFSAVQYGLYLSAYSNANIVLNRFNIPEPAGPPQISGPYGMYLDNCTLYNVEGNTFYSIATVPTTIGLVVNNSGSDVNVIYRNTFLDLKYSTIAEYANRNPSPNTDGLCYVCNNFKSTNVSIGVVFDGTLRSNYGIAAYQNATFNGNIVPTFNLFYNLGTPLPNFDIYNTNCNPITRYYYPPNYNQLNGYSYYPYYRSSNVTAYPSLINFSNQCPNTINYGGTQNQDLPQGEDDIKTKVDSLIKSYKLRNTIESYYELAFLYLQYKETELAEATIQDIPKQFSFTQEDQKTYLAFKDLFKICKDFRTSPVSSLNLSSIQTSELKSINENCHNSIGAYARNLLIAARKINYQEPIILPGLDETTTANDQDESGVQYLNDYFKIRPNPASNYFIVDYDLSSKSGSSTVLKVYSTLGKLVEEEALKPKKDKRLINTAKWVPGLYLVTLEIEGTIVQSSKISITK